MPKKTEKKGRFHSRDIDEEEDFEEDKETEESERDTW